MTDNYPTGGHTAPTVALSNNYPTGGHTAPTVAHSSRNDPNSKKRRKIHWCHRCGNTLFSKDSLKRHCMEHKHMTEEDRFDLYETSVKMSEERRSNNY
ncbi:hypothetical protein CRE_13660 [Caenorhabditis remanei]|uniref:Uncharacterized protein n=1 Tax=Caenorhabditis remanei TaxID=31234 RepID=E3N7I8_CAERE|nr:hypothetical protein CRE_13660 [Caenorhabditis remanei]